MIQQQQKTAGAQGDYDYTKPHTYPRSGRDLVGGVAYLGRAIDKMRADINGTAGEYIAACPQSRKVHALWGVLPEKFKEGVQQQPTDEGVLRWLQEHGPEQPTQDKIKSFSEEMLAAGPTAEMSEWFKNQLKEMGHPDRTDIKTFVDLQDLEEERL